ncbi:hypothetical protein KAW43_01270 [Candidatus Parcubacteria bacterium]|jgi:hypothetical protein|nr:hypothetical protein [Candidatus Parcubacteria bacterium]
MGKILEEVKKVGKEIKGKKKIEITTEQMIEEILSCMEVLEKAGGLIIQIMPREGMCLSEAIRLGPYYLAVEGESYNLWNNIYFGDLTPGRRVSVIGVILKGEWKTVHPRRVIDIWTRIMRAENPFIEVIDW